MPKLLLNHSELKRDFYPLTLTRDLCDLKVGILSIREKWEFLAKQQSFDLELLSELDISKADKIVPANLIPDACFDLKAFFASDILPESGLKKINRLWDVISLNGWSICEDVKLLTPYHHRSVSSISLTTSGLHDLHVSPTATLEHCFININDGPVYIDDNALVMEGAMLRGPLYIGKNSVVKMGATLYGGTTIGNHCVVGGEIKNSIFHSFSNKAHHGYIGDSYIGAWCNLGAGSTCSNLKNTGGKIKVWDIHAKAFRLATQKVGMFMGDHVKSAINTSFNSGTVIGPYANIFSHTGLSPKFIPAFSWGSDGKSFYEFEKLLEEINLWMAMKDKELDKETTSIIYNLYQTIKSS
jgi:UDP-N-acetylglucosamine diphosphorylase/glucosamine-1-phosphate N-acetyltransferase